MSYQPAVPPGPPGWVGYQPAPVKQSADGKMITMFVVAAVLLVLAGVLAASKALATPAKPEPCCTDGLSPVAAGPVRAGFIDTRPGSGAPICVVGSWAASNEKMGAKEFWTNVGGKLTATGTHTYTMRPDGTMTETYKDWTATGKAFGDTVKVTLAGSVEYTWEMAGSQLHLMEQTEEDLTITWLQNGRKLNSRHLTATGTLDALHTLSCQGKTMAESYDPTHSVTWTRTTSYGVYS